MTWTLPILTMARVDDTTARLLAETFADPDRGERHDISGDHSDVVLSPDQWRARRSAVAA